MEIKKIYLYSTLFILGSVLLFTQCTSSSEKEKIHKKLEAEIELINRQTPLPFSDFMQLDSCVLHANNDMEYYYTVINDSIASEKSFFTNIEAEAKKSTKTDPGMADIRSYKISTIYNYRNLNKALVYSFKITPSDYE